MIHFPTVFKLAGKPGLHTAFARFSRLAPEGGVSNSLRDRIAQAINHTAQTHGQTGNLRASPLSAGMQSAMADAALAAIAAAGFAVVPKEPTEEQLAAANRLNHPSDREIYCAAVAAAPKP